VSAWLIYCNRFPKYTAIFLFFCYYIRTICCVDQSCTRRRASNVKRLVSERCWTNPGCARPTVVRSLWWLWSYEFWFSVPMEVSIQLYVNWYDSTNWYFSVTVCWLLQMQGWVDSQQFSWSSSASDKSAVQAAGNHCLQSSRCEQHSADSQSVAKQALCAGPDSNVVGQGAKTYYVRNTSQTGQHLNSYRYFYSSCATFLTLRRGVYENNVILRTDDRPTNRPTSHFRKFWTAISRQRVVRSTSCLVLG